jgi:DNA-binding NarL/FixJ family response regulator
VLLDGFISIFEKEPDVDVVATASNGNEALSLLATTEVDICLLDINMPELNGVQACKKIMKAYPAMKVIALSMYKQASFIKRMKQNGAKGYLLKDDTADELIEAIHTVDKGGEYYSKQLTQILMNNIFAKEEYNQDTITKREKEVLMLMCEGLTNRAISEKLFLSEHTIISHRKNLLIKLKAKNSVEMVKIALEKGLI